MTPIHKFNNGRGATLCNGCYSVIAEGFTEDLLCEGCNNDYESFATYYNYKE
jgi:hypothetical protein